MNTSEQKVAQYLSEARASEDALVRVLQSQIAMTPRGSYRSALETHLDETRRHASRVGAAWTALDGAPTRFGRDRLLGGRDRPGARAGQDAVGSAARSGGEEKVLKNAKDACATEALEIATYTAIERLARSVGDDETAELAKSILADEERMLARDPARDSQADRRRRPRRGQGRSVVRHHARPAPPRRSRGRRGDASAARKTTTATKRTARQARKVPGRRPGRGSGQGSGRRRDDLGIARYDSLTADEITAKLPALSQIDLAKIDSYERKNQNRTTILSRITTLRGDEPWPGYDELTASEVQAVLAEGDDERVKQVLSYERAHKDRAGVRAAAEREVTNA